MARLLSARRSWPTISLLVFVIGISSAVAGDKPDFTYRTNTSEVRLTFSALDQNDHGVATLQASDFAVVDKGFIVRDFQSFTRSDVTKLEIVIAIDLSESVSPRFRKELSDTLTLLAQTSVMPEENISLLEFQNSKPTILCAGNCRKSPDLETLSSATALGMTPLYDTIVFASDFLAKRGDIQTHRILILFSDGQDTFSRHTLRDAMDAALASDVQIDCIDIGATTNPGSKTMRTVAAASGGAYFSGQQAAQASLNKILEGFRASYTVSYRLPTRAQGFHSIQIFPTHNMNLQFRSRSGYYYPENIR